LLSKYPIENPRTLYHYSEREQEATIHAQISVGDRTFDVFNTHLASEDPVENLGQLRELLAEVKGRENVILIGDLNFAPDTPEGQYGLTAEVLDDSWVLKWPQVDKQGADPTGEGIDHVFVSPGTKVVDARYVPGSESESDHPAMTTDIEW
jgi:endonuclease/exonuclease/phosphatase family metal-dependent hydrolase